MRVTSARHPRRRRVQSASNQLLRCAGCGARQDGTCACSATRAVRGLAAFAERHHPDDVSHKLGLKGPSLFGAFELLVLVDRVCIPACQQPAARRGEHALVGAAALAPRVILGLPAPGGPELLQRRPCEDVRRRGRRDGRRRGCRSRLAEAGGRRGRDGDHIYGLVRGVAVNNDGAREGRLLCAERGGQAEVIGRALRAARVDPQSIGYVEAHGTGTALGDPDRIRGAELGVPQVHGAAQFCGSAR